MENVTNVITPNNIMGIKLDETAIKGPVTVEGKVIGFISGVDDNFIYINIFNRGLFVECTDTGQFMQLGIDYRGDM